MNVVILGGSGQVGRALQASKPLALESTDALKG